MKPAAEVTINEILTEMDFGISYTDCLTLNETKWNLPKSTFIRYWKKASEMYLRANEKDKQVIAEVREQVIRERAYNAIMTVEERKELLTQIARGELQLTRPMVVGGGMYSEVKQIPVTPSWKDRKDALAELNKMEGDYAPLKKDITTNGESIAPPPIFNIILEDGEL